MYNDSNVYVDVRADNYGWLANNDSKDSQSFGDGSSDWNSWAATMREGSDCTVRVQRDYSNITITTTAAGETFTCNAYVSEYATGTVYVHLTGENCTLSNIVYEDNTDNTTGIEYDLSLVNETDGVTAKLSASTAVSASSITLTVSADDASNFSSSGPIVTVVGGTTVGGEALAGCTVTEGGATSASTYQYTITGFWASPTITVEWDEYGFEPLYPSSLTCEGWWTNFTDGFEIKNGETTTIKFTNTSNGIYNWDSAIYVVYDSDDGAVNGENYAEYFVGRSDAYGWDSASGNTSDGLNIGAYTVSSTPSDWDAWLAKLQAGQASTLTASMYNGELVVVCTVGDAVTTYAYDTGKDSIYLALGGEACELTNIRYKTETVNPKTISLTTNFSRATAALSSSYAVTGAAVSLTLTPDSGYYFSGTPTVTVSDTATLSDYTKSSGVYSYTLTDFTGKTTVDVDATVYKRSTSSATTTDSTSGSTTDTSNDEETEDGGTQGDLDCDAWWSAHTAGVEVAEGTTVTYTFTNTTDSDAANNWDCPVYVVYTGNEGIVNGSGYTEYFVARADLYGWDAAGGNTNDGLQYGTWTVNSEPDWDTWVSKLKAGVSCTVTASMSDKVLTVTMDVNGAKSTWVYKTNGSTIYISLTGEYTVLSDISYTVKATGSSDSSADDTDKSDDTQDSDSTDSTDNSSDSSSDASGSDSTGSDSSGGSDASTGSDSSSSSGSTTEVSKGDTVTDSSSKGVYTVTSTGNNTVAYAGPASESKTSVTIPATITVDGVTYKVTSIDKNAFSGNTSVKKVTIGKNIKTIGKKAFKGCSSLKKITIKTKSLKAKNVGANAFKGISKKATVKVPSGKKASYKKILTKKGASKKITVK